MFLLRDLIRFDDSANSLRNIFGDASVTKIMHGSANDIKYMIADLGIVTVNLFDTARSYQYIQRIPDLKII